MRQLEKDFDTYIATGWRCTAKAIGPGVYVMRFPNVRDVAKACYIGRMTMKTTGVLVKMDAWSDAVGSKGVMEVALVKVSNVPLEKKKCAQFGLCLLVSACSFRN